MRKFLSNGLFVVAGVVSLPVAVRNAELPCLPSYQADPRLARLKEFFQEKDCPAHQYSEAFIRAADTYQLDWRLLPSISFVESTGGKAARNNNMFGWGNGNRRFQSPEAGIDLVASRLAKSNYYRDKDLDDVLETYNPGVNYPAAVKSIMNRISPK
jgi:hypothetical protein